MPGGFYDGFYRFNRPKFAVQGLRGSLDSGLGAYKQASSPTSLPLSTPLTKGLLAGRSRLHGEECF